MDEDYAKINRSKRERLLDLLMDLEWHDHREIRMAGGVRYSARLLELKRLGYKVVDEDLKPQGKRYRLIVPYRGEPQMKRVKIYLTSEDTEKLLNGDMTKEARDEIESALKSYKLNERKL